MRESGWQLAQRAWRDTDRDWEIAPGRPPVPGPHPDTSARGSYRSGPYARTPYGSGPYAVEPYAPGPYADEPYASDPHTPASYAPERYTQDAARDRGAHGRDRYRPDAYRVPRAGSDHAATPYAPDVFAPDPYALDPYGADEYPAEDTAGEYEPRGYAAAPHAPGGSGSRTGADAAAPYRRGSRASRFDREDSGATRVDFGMPHRPHAAAHGGYPAAPPAPRFYPADPRAEAPHAEDTHPEDAYREDAHERAANPGDAYLEDAYREDTYGEATYGADAHGQAPNPEGAYPEDTYPEDAYAQAPYSEGAYATDGYAVDPEDQTNLAGVPVTEPDWADGQRDARYAAAPVLEDTRTGVGAWPVQPVLADEESHRTAERPALPATPMTDDEADPALDGHATAGAGEDRAGGGARDRWQETRPDRAAPRWSGPDAAGGDDPMPTTLRYARQPPPLPRRTPPHDPRRTGEAPGPLPGRPAQDNRSRVRPPAGPFAEPLSAERLNAERLNAEPLNAVPRTGTAAFSEPDELFRAWQGSVREAAAPDTRGLVRRPAGQAARRRRAWQVARVGVPAVVIVTVGAGALLMLTGRANEMLAERSSTGPARTGVATATAASMILGGYPGMRGGVTVTAMGSASGTLVAVGMADGHPAIWRRAANGNWSLVSAAALGTMTGHLTSVAHGAAGWIAVGSVQGDGMAQPMVYTSADGVTWRTVPALTAFAPSDAQFLGVAAGRGGYLVVGRQGTGKAKFAQLWWSRDLANWTAGGSSGYHNSIAIAAVAAGDGFVAAGSQADCHTIWTSPDGTHWTTHDIARPAGARTATLRYAAAGIGERVVAAGFATDAAGAIPIVVTTDPGGARITQVVLPTGGVPGAVTGVTATGGGFVAAGMIGPAKAQRAVTWTSADGLTWSAATPLSPASGTTITALTGTGGKVTGTLQRGTDPTVQTLPAP